jgi:hypothetical protein
VSLIDEDTEEEKKYMIVGDVESDVKHKQGVDLVPDCPCPHRQSRLVTASKWPPRAARAPTRSLKSSSSDAASLSNPAEAQYRILPSFRFSPPSTFYSDRERI